MRRIGWIVAVVAVLGVAGYLSAQAYSSHIFEQELTRSLEALRADDQWEVEREAVERGWFHSQGQLLIASADEAGWQARIPYEARHGLLSTRLSGALQVALEDSAAADRSRALFGDALPSAEPRWTATYHTLDQRGEGRLDVAGFELEKGMIRLSFTGAEFTAEGRAGNVHVKGQIAPIHWQRGREEIMTGPVHLDTRYQSSADYVVRQRNELILNRLDYKGPQRAPITLTGVRYSDELRLDEQLRLDTSLSVEQALIAEEPLLSGRLSASLDRVDGDAVRRVLAQIDDIAETQGEGLSTLDEAQRQAFLERLEPALLATLDDSPRFILEGMSLSSPLFGIDTRGHGELVFEGENADALSVVSLARNEFEPWLEHLNGRFSWYGIPPLVAMQLGLPLDMRQVEVTIEAGRVSINGRPLPPFT